MTKNGRKEEEEEEEGHILLAGCWKGIRW